MALQKIAGRGAKRSRMRTGGMLEMGVGRLSAELWKADPELLAILRRSKSRENARDALFAYLNSAERSLYNVHARTEAQFLHPIEKNNAKHCVRVLKNILRTEYEAAAGASALSCLLALSRREYAGIGEGFVCEMIALFSGMDGKSGIYARGQPKFMKMEGRGAALERSRFLDAYSDLMEKMMARFGRREGIAMLALYAMFIIAIFYLQFS